MVARIYFPTKYCIPTYKEKSWRIFSIQPWTNDHGKVEKKWIPFVGEAYEEISVANLKRLVTYSQSVTLHQFMDVTPDVLLRT